MKRGKLGLILIFTSLVFLTGAASAAVEFNYWLAGTGQPDMGKFNDSWWDLKDSSEFPNNGIYSGDYNDDYYFLGGGNSEFTTYNGTFDYLTQSETPYSGTAFAMSANSTHVFLGTGQPNVFLYDQNSSSFTDLGIPPDGSSVYTASNSYRAENLSEDYFVIGTGNPSIFKWNGSYFDISPGFFGDSVRASARNKSHFLIGDVSGNIGLYNGSSFKDLSSTFRFKSAGQGIYAIEHGNIGGKDFWLVGGANGILERLWENGTVETISDQLPGNWQIHSIEHGEGEEMIKVGGGNSNLYAYNDRGFFQNEPEFSYSGAVRFIGYNPFPKDGQAPNTSIIDPEKEYYSSKNVPLSAVFEGETEQRKFQLDNEENVTASDPQIVFTDSNNNLKVFNGNETVTDLGVKAEMIGNKAHLDGDSLQEVPFIDSSKNLKIVDSSGEVQTLDTGLDTSKNLVAAGKWQEDYEYVFYVDKSDNDYIKKTRSNESVQTISGGIISSSVLGTADFNDDGDRDIVFLGDSEEIKWLDDGTVNSTGFSSFGSNNDYGLGRVTDIDDDGVPTVPYVTGSNNLALINYTGGKDNLNPNYGSAAKSPITTADLDQNGIEELIHQDSTTSEIKRMRYDGNSKFVKDRNFDKIEAYDQVGLSSGNLEPVNHTLRNLSEGVHEISVYGSYLGNTSGDQKQFTVDLTPPSFRNFRDNVTTDFFQPDTANISAEFRDDTSGLEEVKLSTNETGGFENRTVYGSPETFDNVSDEYLLSDFLWKNESFLGDLGYSLWAVDAAGNYKETSVKSFKVNEIDLEAREVKFENQDPIEGLNFTVNLSGENYGADPVSVGVNLTEETYNGTDWIFVDEKSDNVTFAADSKTYFSFDETAEIGPRRYTVDIDTENEVAEENESNNKNSSILDVSSNQIYYGDSSNEVILGSQTGLNSWREDVVEGNLFYADNDASYSVEDLEPLNGTDDLQEATEALNLEGHNDSIKEEYDENSDGEPDLKKCVVIAGDEVCQIPFVNSTNSSNFQTGILYDSADGIPFDGTQDIVFTSNVTYPEKQGKYGFYSYESRIPATLSAQKGDNEDFIEIRIELN